MYIFTQLLLKLCKKNSPREDVFNDLQGRIIDVDDSRAEKEEKCMWKLMGPDCPESKNDL